MKYYADCVRCDSPEVENEKIGIGSTIACPNCRATVKVKSVETSEEKETIDLHDSLIDDLETFVGMQEAKDSMQSNLAEITKRALNAELKKAENVTLNNDIWNITYERNEFQRLVQQQTKIIDVMDKRLTELLGKIEGLHGRPFSERVYGTLLARAEQAEARLLKMNPGTGMERCEHGELIGAVCVHCGKDLSK